MGELGHYSSPCLVLLRGLVPKYHVSLLVAVLGRANILFGAGRVWVFFHTTLL